MKLWHEFVHYIVLFFKYLWAGIKYVFQGIKLFLMLVGYLLKYLFWPLAFLWKLFAKIPFVNKALNSKTMSVIKAILSGFVWGLGQFFNKQYWKAFFFFFVFSVFIGSELLTSNYFEDTNAYDKLPGVDFGDSWVQNRLLSNYYANKVDDGGYQPFEDYLVTIGGAVNLTEDLFIEFLAQDLEENNPITYTSLSTGIVNDADTFDATGQVHIIRRQSLYTDGSGTYYLERDIKGTDASTRKEYVEIALLTGELNENNILDSKDSLIDFVKSGVITKIDSNYYVKASEGTQTVYIDIMTNTVYPASNFPSTSHTLTDLDLIGPVYLINNQLYEYFEPNLIYNSVRLQYKTNMFIDTVRQTMLYTY